MRSILILAGIVLSWPGALCQARPPRATLDSAGNLLIDGRKRFPIELYSVRTEEDFALARALGFDTAIEFGDGIEERAARHGFLLTAPHWFHKESPDQDAVRAAAHYRQGPAVFAHNLNDEPDVRPEGASPAHLERFARILRAEDPRKLISVTCSGGAGGVKLWSAYARLVDIFRIDPYPLIGGSPLGLVRQRVEQARAAAGPGKPVWAVLQAWSLGPGGGFPDARQDRCMAFLALAAGARGISHFDWNFETWRQHPDFWNGLYELNRQLRLLAPVFLHGDSVPIVSAPRAVRSTAWKWRGNLVAILVNETSRRQEARIQIPRFPGKSAAVEFLFDCRFPRQEGPLLPLALNPHGTAEIAMGFDPYEVRILRAPCSRFPARMDRYPVEGISCGSPAVRVMERWKRVWYRLKNCSESVAEVELDFPKAKARVLELDLALRPLREIPGRIEKKTLRFRAEPQTFYEVGPRPRAFDFSNGAKPFRRLELNLRIESPYPAEGGFSRPALRFRSFTGAHLPLTVHWTSPRPIDPDSVRIEVVQTRWKARLLRREPVSCARSNAGAFHFEIEVGKPARRDRDEVLTLSIRRGRAAISRVVRFRVEPAFDPLFDWDTDAAGVVQGKGTLELRDRFSEREIEHRRVAVDKAPEGWQVSVEPANKPNHFLVLVKPYPGASESGKVRRFFLKVSTGGRQGEKFELPRLLFARGQLLVPTGKPRKVSVPYLEQPIVLDGARREAVWEEAAHLRGFLGTGAVAFADRQPSARLYYNREALFLHVELPISNAPVVRDASAVHPSPADDLVQLYLGPARSRGIYLISMNAAGHSQSFALKAGPGRDPRGAESWNSMARVRTVVSEKRWAVELKIPFEAFPEGGPRAGQRWRFNLRTPHGVAPRYAEVFSYTREWLPSRDELAFLEFGE